MFFLDAVLLGATAASGLADGAVFPVAAGRISDAFFEFQRSTDFGRLSMQFMRCVAGVVAADGFNGVSVSCWILGVDSVCAVCSAHVNHPLPSFPVASFLLPMPLLALSYAPFVIGQAAYLLYGKVFPLEANKGAVFGLELMYTCHRKPVPLAVVVAMVAVGIQGGGVAVFFFFFFFFLALALMLSPAVTHACQRRHRLQDADWVCAERQRGDCDGQHPVPITACGATGWRGRGGTSVGNGPRWRCRCRRHRIPSVAGIFARFRTSSL